MQLITMVSKLMWHRALSFLYPYGVTLNVMKPAVAILSSGTVSFPLNRPVSAIFPGKVRILSLALLLAAEL